MRSRLSGWNNIMWPPCDKWAERQVKDSRRPGMTSKLLFTRDDVIRMCIPFLFFLGVKNYLAFLIFPYPVPVPENFYWLQLRITCKSGWIAQAEKSMLHQQETATVRPFSSLRSKRFQSCYCAKVRAGEKKERCLEGGGRGGKRRRGNSVSIFPLPLPRQSFFSALVPIFSTNSRGNAYYAG